MMAQFDDNLRVIDEAGGDKFRVEVLEYKHLAGSRNPGTAEMLYYANQVGIRLNQVRITLNAGEAILEPGALYFMRGRIDVRSKVGSGGLGGLMRGIATKALTDETAVRPSYTGTGEIYLEPSFGHFLIHPLERGESLIVDKGMFYCSEGTAEVSVAIQKNISSGLMGGEGWFQTRVTGPGICVFASPVPRSEVLCLDLKGEKLQVDGDFALMRTEGVRFSVQRSTRGLFGSAMSGEGVLQTFEGTGKVWIAPTQAVYDYLLNPSELFRMSASPGRRHTDT